MNKKLHDNKLRITISLNGDSVSECLDVGHSTMDLYDIALLELGLHASEISKLDGHTPLRNFN